MARPGQLKMLKIRTKQRFFQTVQSKTCQNDTGKPWIGANLQNVQARQKENLEHKTMQSKWIPTKQIYRSCWCIKPYKSKIKTEMASEIVEERSCSDAYSGLSIVPHNDSGPPTEEQNVKSLGVVFWFRVVRKSSIASCWNGARFVCVCVCICLKSGLYLVKVQGLDCHIYQCFICNIF